jgi:hypothetical protein
MILFLRRLIQNMAIKVQKYGSLASRWEKFYGVILIPELPMGSG